MFIQLLSPLAISEHSARQIPGIVSVFSLLQN